jgi:hypothetical protein
VGQKEGESLADIADVERMDRLAENCEETLVKSCVLNRMESTEWRIAQRLELRALEHLRSTAIDCLTIVRKRRL